MRSLRSLLALFLLLSGAAHADGLPVDRADRLRAAYLFNFLKFVELPHAESESIRVCFIGASGVRESLAASTVDKKIGSRAVATADLPVYGIWSGCDVVYLDAAEDVQTALTYAAGNDALTISEAAAFTRLGGIIRLFTEDNRLRFEINMGHARLAGLKISSDLLRLASRVEP